MNTRQKEKVIFLINQEIRKLELLHEEIRIYGFKFQKDGFEMQKIKDDIVFLIEYKYDIENNLIF